MDGSKNKDLGVTVSKDNDPNKLGDDYEKGLNLGIINQYGQLMGDYSKLDDELWISQPQDDQPFDGPTDMVQCHIVPFHENLVDLAQQSDHADNSVSSGVMMSVDENSSMKYIFQNQSQISSPVSVLQNKRSYSDNRMSTHSQSQHHQTIEHSSLGGLQSLGTSFSAREQKQGFESDQSEHSIGSSLLDDSEESIPAKRTRKISDLLDLNLEPPKKCLHCETSETPQWRTGPMGRKTLCNACGVQYKHGRLFTNYRPLRSPTFDPSLHSNLPKKVQETKMGKTSEILPNPTPKPKKLKEETPTTDPSLRSNLGNNVQEVRVRYTSERHPHLMTNPNKIEGTPVEATSLLSVLDKKVQEMIRRSTTSRDQNITSEPKKVEETRLVSCNDMQSRAERAKKFEEMREKVCDLPSSDSRERNKKSDDKEVLKHKKQLKAMKKCLHCESTKTPQWREGPMGRNTLCNACGVQYRHGRLFPEYCPLKSPKYDPSLHSHLPKKVFEMRMRNSEKCSSAANCEEPA